MHWIVIIIALGIVLASSQKFKGFMGEISIDERLKGLNKKEYIVLKNIILQNHKSEAIKVGYIIVSIYGIFVIENCNYRGTIIGSEKIDRWDQIVNDTRIKFPNPVRQNYANVVAVREVVDYEDIPIVSIVTFGIHANLRVKKERENVIYAADIIKTIYKYDVKKIDKDKIQEIVGILEDSYVQGINSREEMKLEKVNNMESPESPKGGECPRCGGKLLRRKGKYGYFTGCSNYPRCKYVRTY